MARRLLVLELGRVDVCGESRVTTSFVHLCGLPLWPLRSHIVIERAAGSLRIPIALHARSVLVGYLRAWALAAAAASIAWTVWAQTLTPLWLLAAVVLIMSEAVSVWLLAAPHERVRLLRCYERGGGMAVDVALLGAAQSRGDRCHEGAAVRARAVAALRGRAPGAYRDELAPSGALLAALADGDDPAVLEAALTLARLEWGRAHGAERAELAAAHDRLWGRLREVSLRLTEPATQRWASRKQA